MKFPAALRRSGFEALVVLAVIAAMSAAVAVGQPPAVKPPPPAPAAPVADPFTVPDGTPAELIRYLESLRTLQPPAMSPDGMVEFRRKLVAAVFKAADKILAGKPTPEQAETAVYSKVGALAAMDRMGDKTAGQQLAKLPGELRAAGMAKTAREVEAFLLEHRLRAARQLNREELSALVGEVRKFLDAGPLGEMEASLAMMTASIAERTGNDGLAATVYRDFGKLLAAGKEEKVARTGAMMVGAARRMSLVGQPMHVEGKPVDGKPFDWAKYQGKVVLVDFWATWCGPCVAEIPNILENYEAYHDRGFEVIGVNLDDDPERLDAFLQERKLPWTTLYDADLGDKSLATYYGVFGIPTMMLVGPDGKVISMEVRGPRLEKALAKLLGPVEKKAVAAPREKGPSQEN